ncbi:MAG: FAD:protein FMN transferase [Gemmataceae bacterium]|nr:FAD:protein FMN transferase [Gemmataceae bacterium]
MGHQPGSRGWPVGIRHPWEPDRRIAVVSLRNRALATSAATYQYFEYNRKKLGHLLDPRTGWPADGVASATAIAPTGAEADALATAFYVLGVEKSQRYCDLHPEVGAIILPEGSDRPVVFNLTESDVRIVPRD